MLSFVWSLRGGPPAVSVEGRWSLPRLLLLPQRTHVTGGKWHLHINVHIQAVNQHVQNCYSLGVFLIPQKSYDIRKASNTDLLAIQENISTLLLLGVSHK